LDRVAGQLGERFGVLVALAAALIVGLATSGLATSCTSSDSASNSSSERPVATTDSDPDSASTALAVRPDDNPGTIDGDNWLGRGAMTDTSVELIWSEANGLAPNYRIYRTLNDGTLDPEAVALTADLLVYEGPAIGFTDTDVEPERFYTYLLEVDVNGQTLTRRWTTALTITDTEPPRPGHRARE
jgi:hypothetical protein